LCYLVVSSGEACCSTERSKVQVNLNTKICSATPNGFAKIVKGEARIVSGIAGDDEPATPFYQLIDTEVIEISTGRGTYEGCFGGKFSIALAKRINRFD